MEGFLAKRGKRSGSRVKRFMRLQGALLSNHHGPDDAPTWRVDVSDARVACNSHKKRISLEVFGNRLELFADSAADCERWFGALRAAARQAARDDRAAGKENSSPQLAAVDSDGAAAQQPALQRPLARTSDLGKNFKVVKPNPSQSLASRSSNGSDEPADQSHHALTVNGQVYEETPASMIFKQFNFPPK